MTAHTAARGSAPDDVVTTTALVKTYRQGTDEVRALDSELPVYDVKSLDEHF